MCDEACCFRTRSGKEKKVRWIRPFLRNEVFRLKNTVVLLTIVSALSSQILPQILFFITYGSGRRLRTIDPVHDFLCGEYVGAIVMGVCHRAARLETDILVGIIRLGRGSCLLLVAVWLGHRIERLSCRCRVDYDDDSITARRIVGTETTVRREREFVTACAHVHCLDCRLLLYPDAIV